MISSNYRPLPNVLSVISALQHVPLFVDGTCFLLMPVKTAIDPQLLQKRCGVVVQLAMNSVLLTLITDNVMLFIFQKILLFWKVFGWSRIIRISTKACSFASRQFFTYFNVFSKTLWHWNKWQKMRGWTRGSQKSHANQRKILCGVRT